MKRYTDAESLKEDAEAKLDELFKPYRSYTAEIINLVEAVQDEEKKEQYKEVFSIALGDTVLLISKSTGIRESHRIVKFYEYPLTERKEQGRTGKHKTVIRGGSENRARIVMRR